MKSKKTMLILPVVVVALCAVALIGAGFAADYQGSVNNTANDVESVYLKLTEEGNEATYKNAFDQVIYYNTINESGEITYTLENATEDLLNQTVKAVNLGTLTINIEQPDYKSSFGLFVNSNGTMGGGKYYFSIGEVNNAKEFTPGTEIKIADFDKSTETINLTLYFVPTALEEGEDPISQPAKDVEFTITAKATISDDIVNNGPLSNPTQ